MGNYIGVYQSDTSKIDARSMIGISKREFVVLFFGAIRNGKGIEDLIKVFTEMTAPNIKLVIVGKSKDANLTKKIIEASAGSNITFVNNYIADKDVAKYIKACDVFCVPFTENTTSSSVILAMSLRRTVIAPSIGSIKDLPRNTGFYYNPLEANDLRRSIELAHSNKKLTDEKSKNAYRYVTKNSWKKSANLTYSLYKELSG
jgi:glycosyltransferase involved in cell wall biosynthesis